MEADGCPKGFGQGKGRATRCACLSLNMYTLDLRVRKKYKSMGSSSHFPGDTSKQPLLVTHSPIEENKFVLGSSLYSDDITHPTPTKSMSAWVLINQVCILLIYLLLLPDLSMPLKCHKKQRSTSRLPRKGAKKPLCFCPSDQRASTCCRQFEYECPPHQGQTTDRYHRPGYSCSRGHLYHLPCSSNHCHSPGHCCVCIQGCSSCP